MDASSNARDHSLTLAARHVPSSHLTSSFELAQPRFPMRGRIGAFIVVTFSRYLRYERFKWFIQLGAITSFQETLYSTVRRGDDR